MCGICGIVHADPRAPIASERVQAMRDIMAHRGPDDAGTFASRSVDLGSRRLAILDLSAEGHMPMGTPDGRYWISYNGESYNFAELRPSLEAKGYKFHSGSDTEVLLYLYAEEGPGMLHWLNGMFALAIWDERDRRLFLARDRLGVKPLYYAEESGALFFASEQKALFAAGVRPEFDAATWEELLCFRYVAGERTPFVGVKRLLPGHYLLWQEGEVQIRRWWNLGDRAAQLRHASPHDPADWLRQTLDESVDQRRVADVPVGVLLSGGLDSSCVVGSLGAQGVRGIASFTVRFREPYYDEGPLARSVAEQWGLEHHEVTVSEDDLFDLVQYCSWLADEPLAHGNDPHLHAIALYAKQHVTVLLSGEGADETMGGYVRYGPLRHARGLAMARLAVRGISSASPAGFAGSLMSRIHKLNRLLNLGGVDEFVLHDACDVLPNDLAVLGFTGERTAGYRRSVLAEAKELYPSEPLRQAMYLDQHTFLNSILDRNDRTTMGASIECRVPFLDYRLVEGLAAMPSAKLFRHGPGKSLLRDTFEQRLPPLVLGHRKWGFGVPWQDYFQKQPRFRELIAALPDTAPVCDGPFDLRKVREVVSGYLGGDLTHHALIRQLVFITIWYRTCLGGVRPSAMHSPSSSSRGTTR